jgi:hypothetical protein
LELKKKPHKVLGHDLSAVTSDIGSKEINCVKYETKLIKVYFMQHRFLRKERATTAGNIGATYRRYLKP